MSETKILTREELIDEVVQYLKDDESVHADALEELDSWCGYLNDDRWYDMGEFDDLMYGSTPSEIAEKITEDFNIRDDYFRFTIYGLESSNYKEYDDYDEADTVEYLIDCYPNVNVWDGFLSTAISALVDNYERYEVDDGFNSIEGVEEE